MTAPTQALSLARDALAETTEILDAALMIGLPTLPPGADGPAVKARAAIAALDALAQQASGPSAEPVTLADVLDALNLFNRPKPSEDDGPWEGGHFIRVDHLPDFINVISAAWFAPQETAATASVAGLVDAEMAAYSDGAYADHGSARDQLERFAAAVRATPPAASAPTVHPLTEAQIEALQGLDTSSRVRFYEHDFYVLSNFSAFSIKWQGRKFPTSEHAYHWEKFAPGTKDENGFYVRDQIMDAWSAHDAYKMAERRKPLRRPDWDAVKVDTMRGLLRAKADQHEYVRRKLLATGNRELVEDSWRDDFWGWGPDRKGQNMLGRLWMEVRAELAGITAAPTKE